MIKSTYKIRISGRVQGVGFRPFIYNLANNFGLNGTVSNDVQGVLIYLNTTREKTIDFVNTILSDKPEIAVINSTSYEKVNYKEHKKFSIILTEPKGQLNLPLTPDFAICQACKFEINDAKNSRFNYAFTTCVHCGPRYSITSDFPFERANTSLNDYAMCSSCQNEYTDPSNKRFHSQTNSCHDCGVQLKLVDKSTETVEENQVLIIKQVAQHISNGQLVAIKNTNGYLLCCSATSSKAINELRKRKKRPNKPFAVLYPSIDLIEKDFIVSKTEKKELQSSSAPIVILQNKRPIIDVESIAPNLNQTGVMLPSSALLELIMTEIKTPIVATSGNIHGSPIISNAREAEINLKNVTTCFLHHNLTIEFPQDDSVVRFSNDKQIILRRSGRLAPNYLEVSTTATEPILAMGAHLKSTFTFVPNTYTYVSQYFGNLDNYEVVERFQSTIKQYIRIFKNTPKTIVIDKHPNYQSSVLGTELSSTWNTNLIEVQHHKAHFCSVLGEHDLFDSNEKILGVIWDGTGLGDDNHIWGGEFFEYKQYGITRVNHFEYVDWIANDRMSKDARLCLVSLLNEEKRHLVEDKFSGMEWNIYTKTIKNNSLKTSSVGRLFDAVASALNLTDINSFEGEAAMLLEDCANQYKGTDHINYLEGLNEVNIPSRHLIERVLDSFINGVNSSFIAANFIYTLATTIVNQAIQNKFRIIACSGGVFQNELLIKMLLKLAEKENLIIKLNRKLSPNDENISFGQLMYHQNIKN